MSQVKKLEIEVWADWSELPNPTRMGLLAAMPGRGKDVFSFTYDKDWLSSGLAQNLDPALQLYEGPQYPPTEQNNFGLFLDSSPDRWGRFLMRRREAQNAKEQGHKPRDLRESDYLLGVYDGHRIGALRFKTKSNGPFLDDNTSLASPPWTSLRELEHASLQLEKDGAENDPDYSKWLKMLIMPGASLGGARPKASVIDPSGHLWIAKFPSRSDTEDKGAWEAVAHALAGQSGISIPSVRAQIFSGKYHTFLTKRFDRTDKGKRIHFASAMTLLRRSEGDDASTGASYLELAQLLATSGAYPNEDLEQLWRRIVLSICISNVDDHLRNHGFLLRPEGWQLSPAYDMNPSEVSDGLKLNISEDDNSQNLDLALDVAPYFRLSKPRAAEICKQIVDVVKGWRACASKHGIGASEQNRMANAFRVADSY
ncbi:MAG: type II toxin-antitoxin system HipA family toxin [Bdellovibrionales bacterium]|nr:type II toxin-antitoxin system HipA family toxin [Bdellovibrionales bacterium]